MTPRRAAAAALAALALGLLAGAAFAQDSVRPATGGGPASVATSERTLWLAASRGEGFALFSREVGGAFDLGQPVSTRILSLTAWGEDAVALFGDGSLLRFSRGKVGGTPLRILPDGALPIDLTSDGRTLYALVDDRAASRLSPATQPGRAVAPSGLSVAMLDDEWTSLGSVDIADDLRGAADAGLRLVAVQQKLALVWLDARKRVLCAYRDPAAASWSQPATLAISGAQRVWLAMVNGTATVVALSDEAGQEPPLRVLRLFGRLEEGAAAWSAATPQWSEMPVGAVATRYLKFFGFTQHLGAVVADASGEHYLRFARFGETPLESTTPVRSVFEQVTQVQRTFGALQLITFLVLLAIITGLFTLRRDSMVRPVTPPAHFAIAMAFQRLVALLIDFLPFTLVAARAAQVNWGDALRTIAQWGLSPDPSTGMPAAEVLTWWGLSIGGFIAYSTIMEAITSRTVGKVLVGTRVFSESAGRPSFGQILARNAIRVVELLPQFWVFGLLVLLSRNRQRLGDVFARTIVCRPAPPPEELIDSSNFPDAP